MAAGRDADAIAALRDALAEVGLSSDDVQGSDRGVDLVVRGPQGGPVGVEVKRVSLVSGPALPHLARQWSSSTASEDHVVVVVADRVTAEAREQLRSLGWGWLDLRGHLRLVGSGVFIDAQVAPQPASPGQALDPMAGRVSLEVAALLLLEPDRRRGVRQIASELGRAASSVSQALSRLRESGLLDNDGRPVTPDLFRELARRWRPETYDVAKLPTPGRGADNRALRLGLAKAATEPGWALGDSLAAVAYGAPLHVSGSYPPDLYVPDKTTVRRAIALLGVPTEHQSRAASLRVAPVPLVCTRRVDATAEPALAWPLAHPLFVALDLAQDPGRGSEALDAWTPQPPWHRVW